MNLVSFLLGFLSKKYVEFFPFPYPSLNNPQLNPLPKGRGRARKKLLIMGVWKASRKWKRLYWSTNRFLWKRFLKFFMKKGQFCLFFWVVKKVLFNITFFSKNCINYKVYASCIKFLAIKTTNAQVKE